MMTARTAFALLILCGPFAGAAGPPVVPVDHHQHLLRAEMAGPGQAPIGATELIAMLNAAFIHRAVLLSNAFRYDDAARVREENDWTAAEAAKFPQRLVAFCSFNPLKSYALAELERCAADPRFGRGIKLQFGSSGVDLDNHEHVKQLRRVFAAANAHGLALVVHLRTASRFKYGAAEAEVVLNQLLAAAPEVTVQIAHLAGGGGGAPDEQAVDVLDVFTAALARHDPRVKNLYFDVAGVATPRSTPEEQATLVRYIRTAGIGRVLYGSDGGDPTDPTPKDALAAFRKLPLKSPELRAIENNIAPYFRIPERGKP